MEKTDHGKRIYYTMGEVSEMFDVNPSLIRFWEQKFEILKPHKNKKGNRMFTPQDVDNLKLIYHLVKEKGMTLSGAQKRLKENREGIERNLEIIEKLQGVKAMLLEIRQELKDGNGPYEEIVIESIPDEITTINVTSKLETAVPETVVVIEQVVDAEVSLSEEVEEAASEDAAEKPKGPRIIEPTLF